MGLALLATLAVGCGGAPDAPRADGEVAARVAAVEPGPARPLGRVTSAKTGAVLELLDLQRTGRQVLTARFALSLPASAPEPWDLSLDLTDPANLSDYDSVGGATLIDEDSGRVQPVLRGAGDRALASGGLAALEPGRRIELFAKFPAPPASTRTVAFALPTFPSIDGIRPGT